MLTLTKSCGSQLAGVARMNGIESRVTTFRCFRWGMLRRRGVRVDNGAFERLRGDWLARWCGIEERNVDVCDRFVDLATGWMDG